MPGGATTVLADWTAPGGLAARSAHGFRQFVVLAVRPDVPHRIQLWRVGRQILRRQPALLVADELLGEQGPLAQTLSSMKTIVRPSC